MALPMMSLEHNEVVDGVREWLLPHSARKMKDSNVLEEFMPAKDFGETMPKSKGIFTPS